MINISHSENFCTCQNAKYFKKGIVIKEFVQTLLILMKILHRKKFEFIIFIQVSNVWTPSQHFWTHTISKYFSVQQSCQSTTSRKKRDANEPGEASTFITVTGDDPRFVITEEFQHTKKGNYTVDTQC